MERTIGAINYYGHKAEVRIEVELGARWGERETQRELSICGSIWRPRAKDCDACGQISELLRPAEWLAGPTVDVPRLLAIWDRWHLNGMRAGCEHQRAEKWDERKILIDKPLDAYVTWEGLDGRAHSTWNMLTWASRKEHVLGLLSEPCPTCGYKYGTAWLKEELPEDVLRWAIKFNDREE